MNGYFTADEMLPGGAVLTVTENALTMKISASELVWKGDATHNVWDTTSQNWQNNLLFVDHVGVTFDDSADAGTETVEIAAEVSPGAVRVRGERNYTFTGAGMTGVGNLEKLTGNSVLTLANANTYTGVTAIDAGAFVLSGALSGSPVSIGGNAVFTNTVTGKISGPVGVSILGSACELDGTNDFTGGLLLAAKYTEAFADIAHVVRNPAALGDGPVSVTSGTLLFSGTGGVTGRGRTLTVGQKSQVLLYTGYNSAFTWLGDVEIQGTPSLNLRMESPLTFGEPGCSTTVRASGGAGIYVRHNSSVHWYSRLDVHHYHQTDYNTSHFYAVDNKWEYLNICVNGVVCHATNTLAVAPVQLGQIWETSKFRPSLDLNGFDQTISALEMRDVIEGTTQTVTSGLPAILTITNDTDTVTARQ